MSAPLAARSEQTRSARVGPANPSESSAGDRELLASLRAREAGAVTALHARTRSVIAGTVNRLLGRTDPEAEDLAQLAFIELLDSLENCGELQLLNAWVRVISSRAVYRHIKRRRFERSMSGAISTQTMTGTIRGTPHDFLFRDALRRVRRHLSRLDASRTFTFLLHDVYGYDMREVARMTGVSVAAARTRLTRGRREVRKRIFSDPELANLASELRVGQHASKRPCTTRGSRPLELE
jgi:RNA polymerase sigma-70 factor (ECF subfamily)